MKKGNRKFIELRGACSKIGSGVTPRGGDATYLEEGVALIRSQNIYNAEFSVGGLAFIGNEQAETMAGVTVVARDVLLNITGDSVARACIVPESVLPARVNQHVAIIRTNPESIDPRYLMYYLVSPYMQAFMLSVAGSGGTRKALTKAMIEGFKVPDLLVEEQRKIADTLSTYDDLIENNRRRIQLLEQAARLLYKEWFVHLRFPGHEHAQIKHGVPKGWEVRPLSRCATFLSGGTPSKAISEYWDGNIPWVSSGELTRPRICDASLRITPEAAEAGSRLVPRNTILAVVRGMSLAKEFRLGITTDTVAFNQDIKALVAEPDIDPVYLFSALSEQKDYIRDRATEASHGTKKLDTPVLCGVQILVPPMTWQNRFREWADRLNAQWDNVWQQNAKLTAARDLLLPRLMSGELVA